MSPRDTYTYCDHCKRAGSEYKNYKCTHCGAIGCYREGCPNRNWSSNTWVGDTCLACGKHDCVTPRGDISLTIVGPDLFKRNAGLEPMPDYRPPSPPKPAMRPSFWRRLMHPFRAPGAVKRVLDHQANGTTSDRFRRLLERAGCRVEKIDTSNSRVLINFVFVEDEGRCIAFLTDRLQDGSYLRCNIVARIGMEFPLEQVNKLNQHSKFLKFHNIHNNSLFIEYPFALIELTDTAILVNIEIFHDSVMYLASNGFVYDGMNKAPVDAERFRAAIRQRSLWDRVNYPGKGGARWSADDEDHAWRIGVIHAYAREKFNPPIQPEYRAIYLDGYKTTTDDEGLNNDYPDS